MNLEYLLLFVYFVQVLNYSYGDGDPSSYELDRGPKCPFSDNTVSMVILTRENRRRDFYTLQTLHNHPEFKKKAITRQVVFITHGFTSSASSTNFVDLSEAMLDKNDVLVILIDWRVAACTETTFGTLYYSTAVSNTRLVGVYIAKLIKRLIEDYNVPITNIRLIGHSLGAHVSGFAGKEVQKLEKDKVSEIIGLDPAGPSFESNDCSERLCETDARYVQIIHTSKKFGIERRIGHVDFYVNKANIQPGCGIIPLKNDICSHSRAVIYMTECIKHECCLIGIPQSKSAQPISSCTRDECVCVGLEAKSYPNTGSFYVPVKSTAPFCNNNGKII